MSDVNYCVNCKHYKPPYYDIEVPECGTDAICYHPNVSEIDYVDCTITGISPYHVRGKKATCAWFEPKPPSFMDKLLSYLHRK